jgi:hypothetical protein
MTARKKFDRPVHVDPEVAQQYGPVRKITMARESGALEGAYAAYASRDELRLSPYDAYRRDVVSTGVKAFIGLVLFWAAIAMLLSTFFLAR